MLSSERVRVHSGRSTRLLENKYYLDVPVRAHHRASCVFNGYRRRCFAWFDANVVDGAVNGVGRVNADQLRRTATTCRPASSRPTARSAFAGHRAGGRCWCSSLNPL